MQPLPQGVFGIVTTQGFKAGEEFDPEFFKIALGLARKQQSGEVRILMGGRALLCLSCGAAGVLVSSGTDGHSTWSARRRAEAMLRRPLAYRRVMSKSGGQLPSEALR